MNVKCKVECGLVDSKRVCACARGEVGYLAARRVEMGPNNNGRKSARFLNQDPVECCVGCPLLGGCESVVYKRESGQRRQKMVEKKGNGR